MKTMLALLALVFLTSCEPQAPPTKPLDVTWREINGPAGGNKIYVAWDPERAVWMYVTYAGNGIAVFNNNK